MKFFYLFMTAINIMFISFSHPMFLTILVITQSVNTCFLMMLKNQNSWVSYILFLIFIGGMMILFMYMCSLTSNEMIKLKLNKLPVFLVSVMFVLMLVNLNNHSNYGLMLESHEIFMKMFHKLYIMVSMLVMLYLLLTLVIIVKNVMISVGPIRTKKFL